MSLNGVLICLGSALEKKKKKEKKTLYDVLIFHLTNAKSFILSAKKTVKESIVIIDQTL